MKEILQFFKKCPAFDKVNLREDFLSPLTGSSAIVPDGGEGILKRYTTGDILGQYNYKIMLREAYIGQASEFFLKLTEWLGKGYLPDMEGEKTAQYIEITGMPELIKSEVGAGIYHMKIRLVYYAKGERI